MVVSEPNFIVNDFGVGHENFVKLWPENEVTHRKVHVSLEVHLESSSCLDGGVVLYDNSESSNGFSSFLAAENDTLSSIKIDRFSSLVFHDNLNASFCVLTKVCLNLWESFVYKSHDVSVHCFDWEKLVTDQLEER